jgi:glycosyltransferase involved in cell wall biosynthesis
MKELSNLKTLNKKKLLVAVPINNLEEEVLNETLYSLASQTEETDVLLLVSDSLDDDILKKINKVAKSPIKKVVKTDEKENVTTETLQATNKLNFVTKKVKSENFASVYNVAFNEANANGYKWVSVIDNGDLVEEDWVHYFDRYSSEMDGISIFLPLTRQISAGNMVGHLNEATWLEGKAEVAGQADLQILMSWNCLSPTGCMVNVSDVVEYSEERDGKYYPFKEKMNLASSYEFFLRMIYEDLKTYTIPRYGYQMRMDKNESSFSKISSKIPSNITSLPKENGGMTQHEVGFWMEQAKTEYFMSEDRDIEYETQPS